MRGYMGAIHHGYFYGHLPQFVRNGFCSQLIKDERELMNLDISVARTVSDTKKNILNTIDLKDRNIILVTSDIHNRISVGIKEIQQIGTKILVNISQVYSLPFMIADWTRTITHVISVPKEIDEVELVLNEADL